MLAKMMTTKVTVKTYDMKTIQGARKRQFWASLFMCYSHLKRGMIKPMMMQVCCDQQSCCCRVALYVRRNGTEDAANPLSDMRFPSHTAECHENFFFEMRHHMYHPPVQGRLRNALQLLLHVQEARATTLNSREKKKQKQTM